MKISFENIAFDKESFFKISFHDYQNPCDVFWHYHPQCELIYVPNGSAKRKVGEHNSHYINGDLVLIAPNVPHLNFNYQQRRDHEEIVIQFNLEKLISSIVIFPEMSNLSDWLKEIKTGICFGPAIRKRLDKDIRKLLVLPPVERTFLLLKILYSLSNVEEIEYLDGPLNRKNYNFNDGDRINKVYKYVKDNYHLPVDIQTVVGLTNLSQAAFCRFLKKVTKMSFTEFLNEYRVQKACEMLLDGITVTEAAYATGFNSISHFNVTFKKVMKMSPSNYKNSKKMKIIR